MSDTAETGSAPRGGAVHWLVRIAERAGHGDKERPEIEAGSGTPAAWTEVTRAYGISDSELSALVANYFRLEVANFAESDPNAALLIPETMARKHLVFPLVEDDRRFVVATCDPTNVEAERALGFTTGRTSLFQVAAPGAIQEALDARFSPERVVETLLGGIGDEIDDDAVKLVEEMGPEAISEDDAGATPVIRLTSLIIRDAITQAASDIHIEPGRKLGAVRYRVDGVLRKHMDLPMAAFNRVISRVKVMGQMDIADRLRPQDGKARVQVNTRGYDLRVSTIPAGGRRNVSSACSIRAARSPSTTSTSPRGSWSGSEACSRTGTASS